jgi:capsular exopolysaccharide synthesis family protein
MELKQYLHIVRRWLWLLILGIALGGAAGYYYSTLQQPVYRASTRLMVMSAPQDQAYYYDVYMRDQQLTQTYLELLTTQPVLDAVSEKLGSAINGRKIQSKQVRDTSVIQLIVDDPNPVRAAEIANLLVQVLIEQSNAMQAGRYASTEESIQAQIAQIEGQIESLQREVDLITTRDFQEQLRQVETQIQPLQEEVSTLQQEIAALSPAVKQDAKAQIAEKQARINQIQPLLSVYQQIYSNLVVLGRPTETDTNTSTRMTQLQSTLDLYQSLYINLLSSLEAIRLARLQNTPNIVQIEPAVAPKLPINPGPLINIALAAVVGLMLAAGIVFLVEYLDDTLKTPEDVAHALGLPVLGLVSDMRRRKKDASQVYVVQQPRSPVSEAFRSLRTNLEFAAVERPIKTLLVTSPGPGEGKTTVAANLAAIFSQAEKRVALIDADLRRPGVHSQFGVSNREGLGNVFLNRARPNTVSRRKDELPNLFVMTSGSLPPNPSELLSSQKMDQILSELSSFVDLVVIDTPPTIVADASILAAKVDAVLFVIQPGTTHAQAVQASLDVFKRAGARVVGVVMNRIPRARKDFYGGYDLYSPYGESKSYFAEEEKAAKEAAQKQAETPLLTALQASTEPGATSTIEAPRSTSYLGSLFEQLNELPPPDPKQNGSSS